MHGNNFYETRRLTGGARSAPRLAPAHHARQRDLFGRLPIFVGDEKLPHDLAVAIEGQPHRNLPGRCVFRRGSSTYAARRSRAGNWKLSRRAVPCGSERNARDGDRDRKARYRWHTHLASSDRPSDQGSRRERNGPANTFDEGYYWTASPCTVTLRPSRSMSSVTRSPITVSMILTMMKDTTAS